MEVLFWLLPAGIATAVAMLWVGWWGREGRGQVDRETAARRLGEALSREQRTRPGYAVPPRERDRSTGIALRPSKARPVVVPAAVEEPVVEESVVVKEPASEAPARDRRAS